MAHVAIRMRMALTITICSARKWFAFKCQWHAAHCSREVGGRICQCNGILSNKIHVRQGQGQQLEPSDRAFNNGGRREAEEILAGRREMGDWNSIMKKGMWFGRFSGNNGHLVVIWFPLVTRSGLIVHVLKLAVWQDGVLGFTPPSLYLSIPFD